MGAEVGQIVKSLVFVADDGDGSPVRPYLALVSGSNMADVDALAQAVGEKSIRRSTADEARAATGFAIGGIPPFGHRDGAARADGPGLARVRRGLGGGRHRQQRFCHQACRSSAPQWRDRGGHRSTGGRGRPTLDSPRPPAQRQSVQYPGGLAARYRWGGTGSAAEVFAITEAGGRLTDHGPLEGAAPDRLCRAELHVEGPLGAWTARFASLIYDEPEGALWDTNGLLLVKYGFRMYALGSRTGELAWSHRSGTPVVAVLCSPSFEHCYRPERARDVGTRCPGRGRLARHAQRGRHRRPAHRRAARAGQLRRPATWCSTRSPAIAPSERRDRPRLWKRGG